MATRHSPHKAVSAPNEIESVDLSYAWVSVSIVPMFVCVGLRGKLDDAVG
jgi:hypothetical protein